MVAPKDCPTPEYHETFNYCPSCEWTIGVCGAIKPGVDTFYCDLAKGHSGKHSERVMWD